ncbi:MAG: hypothetical protein ACTS4Z_02745 [Candidatus Hodgkinia cicadicola]
MKYSVSTNANNEHVKLRKNRISSKPIIDLNKFVDHERSTDMTELVYEKVIKLSKVSKVVKGGRRYKYCALVVVGNLCGKASAASAKAADAADAVVKAIKCASKLIINCAVVSPANLTYRISGACNATKVIITPTREGTGIRASNVVKAILDAFGVFDVSAKVFGSTNSHNVIGAVFNAFQKLHWHQQIWLT